jgi:hypothetical protein
LKRSDMRYCRADGSSGLLMNASKFTMLRLLPMPMPTLTRQPRPSQRRQSAAHVPRGKRGRRHEHERGTCHSFSPRVLHQRRLHRDARVVGGQCPREGQDVVESNCELRKEWHLCTATQRRHVNQRRQRQRQRQRQRGEAGWMCQGNGKGREEEGGSTRYNQ